MQQEGRYFEMWKAQFPIDVDLTGPITDRSLAAEEEMGGSVFGYFPYFATMLGDERLSARWRELCVGGGDASVHTADRSGLKPPQ